MPTTPIVDLPYPTPGDPADVPADIEALAMTLDELLAPKPVTPAGMELIWDTEDAGVVFPVASVSTPTIPQTFKHLLVAWRASSDNPTAGIVGYLGARINGYPTGYYDQALLGTGTAPSSNAGNGTSTMRMGLLNGASSGTYSSGGLALIPNYASVLGFCGQMLGLSGCFTGASATTSWVAVTCGMYGVSQASVLSMSFLDQGGANLRNGSRISLFGLV